MNDDFKRVPPLLPEDERQAHASEFEREARHVPEEYYEGTVSGAEADEEIAELTHLSEIARDLARHDRH